MGLVPRRRTPPLSFEVRRAVAVLGVLLLAAFASVWITDLSNSGTIQARLAFSGLAAFGCLAAIGLERLRLPVIARFALPILGLAGTVSALISDVWQVCVN